MSALLYPSSWIGYVRLALAGGSLVVGRDPRSDSEILVVVGLLAVSRLLDPLDGWVARRRGQTSRIGSALDLLVDLATHSVVWWLSGLSIGLVLLALEWIAGAGILWTVIRGDERWKSMLTEGAPRWVRAYFRNDMRNLLCALGVIGHFTVPMTVFAGVNVLWTLLAVPGLILYEAVTLYLVVAVFIPTRN